MGIGELAERGGTTTRALRYYESRGLLTSRRDSRGYRAYDEEDLRILQQIKLLQDFGFELEETRPFVDCLRSGHPAGDSCPASREVYRAKLAELDALIERLEEVRDAVRLRLSLAADAAPEPSCELFPAPPPDRREDQK
ncbi:MerR family transcriptional regulator [Phaeacidiphilus oryzae]|uniref:MerR family transcriptional regulator n=1 Tax=Phaeacidiphilus oryzae TaxID=348818 RepID=UPI0006919681|nr:MerR family transcriptional regulator [Phaeacidiphilus oryzae]